MNRCNNHIAYADEKENYSTTSVNVEENNSIQEYIYQNLIGINRDLNVGEFSCDDNKKTKILWENVNIIVNTKIAEFKNVEENQNSWSYCE